MARVGRRYFAGGRDEEGSISSVDKDVRVKCWRCDGSGERHMREEWYTNCKTCGGTGKVPFSEVPDHHRERYTD